MQKKLFPLLTQGSLDGVQVKEMLTKQQQHPFDLAPFITNWLNSTSDYESVGSETSSILISKSKSQFHCLHNTENYDSISDDDEDNELVRDYNKKDIS